MLIFRHEDGSKLASPEQLQIWMKQTMDWIGGIAAQNKFVEGNGLPFEDSKVVWHNNVVTNGPFGEIKEIWRTPEADQGLFCYNAKAHPNLSQPGELLISYNTITLDFWNDIQKNAHIYRPRFVRLKWQ